MEKSGDNRRKTFPIAGARSGGKTNSKWGPNFEEVMKRSSTVHPGIPHLFDVKTQKHFTIETKQADSEVVLVEKGVVHYRISPI